MVIEYFERREDLICKLQLHENHIEDCKQSHQEK